MLTSLGIYTFSSLSARATVGQMTSTFLPGHARICIRGPLITPCFPHKRPPLATALPAGLGKRVCGVNDVRSRSRIGVSAMTMATSDDVILVADHVVGESHTIVVRIAMVIPGNFRTLCCLQYEVRRWQVLLLVVQDRRYGSKQAATKTSNLIL
jgi:hypothetical protein